jgi:membrane protein implicated in regulation of membrane protease activity
MQLQMRSVRFSGWLGLFLILAALILLPFALLFGLIMLVLGLVGSLVSLLLGRKPRPKVEESHRSQADESIPAGKILDVEYEVKNEPKAD